MLPDPRVDPTARLQEYVARVPEAARAPILALAMDLPPLYVDRLGAAVEALDDAVTLEVALEYEQMRERILSRLPGIAHHLEQIWSEEQGRVLTRQ
jgi:hypothetical protein